MQARSAPDGATSHLLRRRARMASAGGAARLSKRRPSHARLKLGTAHTTRDAPDGPSWDREPGAAAIGPTCRFAPARAAVRLRCLPRPACLVRAFRGDGQTRHTLGGARAAFESGPGYLTRAAGQSSRTTPIGGSPRPRRQESSQTQSFRIYTENPVATSSGSRSGATVRGMQVALRAPGTP